MPKKKPTKSRLKSKSKGSDRKAPAWKTQWPLSPDLFAWFRCMLKKCDAIEDAGTASSESHLPIEAIAELGYVDEALKHVRRYLRRLPNDELVEIVRLCELGAKICLDAGDFPGIDKFLARAESMERHVTRKCDVGFAVNSVRDFRALHGILDPEDAADEKQRVDAEFNHHLCCFKQAMKRKRKKVARSAVDAMHKTNQNATALESWEHESNLRWIVRCYGELGDVASAKRSVKHLNQQQRDRVLDSDALVEMGYTTDAIKCSKRTIKRELQELNEGEPNIHFPVWSICRELSVIAKHESEDAAKRQLKKCLSQMSKWTVWEHGQFTASVYRMFADAAAEMDMIDLAKELLANAEAEAGQEKRVRSRKAAKASNLTTTAQLVGLDAALEKARKLRSKPQRTKEVAKLLAKAGRFKELKKFLSEEVQSPEQAADLCWWIKFELPGGSVS